MAASTKIEWTEMTWNPVTGCSKISAGCANCYAERMAHRLHAMGNVRYRNKFSPTVHRDLFNEPLKWKSSKLVFVCSMSDLFHEEVDTQDIMSLFEVMNMASKHTFQVLTKRSNRMLELAPKLKWTDNIWAGVTVENQDTVTRIDDLRNIPASIRFVSFEPLLGPIADIKLEGIDWAIVGGESGPKARSMDESWVRDIKAACEKQQVSFFFKQWGGVNKKKNGRELDNTTWDDYPVNY